MENKAKTQYNMFYNLKIKITCLNGIYFCCFDKRQINIDFNVRNPWLLSHIMYKNTLYINYISTINNRTVIKKILSCLIEINSREKRKCNSVFTYQ